MKTRGESLMESFVVIAILLAIYWVAGLIILKLFKKEIRNEKGYLACIIGGFILRVGDLQYNASVANQLNKLKREFTLN